MLPKVYEVTLKGFIVVEPCEGDPENWATSALIDSVCNGLGGIHEAKIVPLVPKKANKKKAKK